MTWCSREGGDGAPRVTGGANLQLHHRQAIPQSQDWRQILVRITETKTRILKRVFSICIAILYLYVSLSIFTSFLLLSFSSLYFNLCYSLSTFLYPIIILSKCRR